MSNSSYPKHIVPLKGWRRGILAKEILSRCTKAFVGHRIDGTMQDCLDDSLGEDALVLREKALPTKRIPNLSTNLLGGRFGIKDFAFVPKNAGKLDWVEGVDVSDILLVEENFEELKGDIFVVGWMVGDIDGRECGRFFATLFLDYI